jgi:hypothetical protein
MLTLEYVKKPPYLGVIKRKERRFGLTMATSNNEWSCLSKSLRITDLGVKSKKGLITRARRLLVAHWVQSWRVSVVSRTRDQEMITNQDTLPGELYLCPRLDRTVVLLVVIFAAKDSVRNLAEFSEANRVV